MDRKKILLVEDEAIIALEIRVRLENQGKYKVAMASTSPEALNQAQEFEPDLILMDMMLRGEKDGIATAQEIRKAQDVPLIFMTGNSHMRADKRLQSVEPYWFLIKPVPDFKLLETIRSALEETKP